METIERIIVGVYQTNCYVLKENTDVLIIDPGKKPERICEHIKDTDKVNAIVLTHGHFDHIGAVDALANMYNCPIYVHDMDVNLLQNCPYNKMDGYEGSVYHKTVSLKEGIQKIGNFTVEVLHAPGHTEGSCLILYKNSMFSGDVLFQGSIGRTDLYSGNESEMKQTIKMIKALDNNFMVYPGHGNPTTLDAEKETNPYYIF